MAWDSLDENDRPPPLLSGVWGLLRFNSGSVWSRLHWRLGPVDVVLRRWQVAQAANGLVGNNDDVRGDEVRVPVVAVSWTG